MKGAKYMQIILYSIKCSKCSIIEKKLKKKNIPFTLVEGEDGEDGKKAI